MIFASAPGREGWLAGMPPTELYNYFNWYCLHSDHWEPGEKASRALNEHGGKYLNLATLNPVYLECVCSSIHGHLPPPTRHITFFVTTWPARDLGFERLITSRRQARTFLPREFENAYWALISSPGKGAPRIWGSTRSTKKSWGNELTIRATSTSKGSRGFPMRYFTPTGGSAVGVNTRFALLERDEGRDDTEYVKSRKLDGGPERRLLRDTALVLPGVDNGGA